MSAGARHIITIPLLLSCLAGCAAMREEQAIHQRELAEVRDHGVALVVDSCIYRQSPPFSKDYYVRNASLRSAAALREAVRAWLNGQHLRVSQTALPYACGSLAVDAPKQANVADDIDHGPIVKADLPLPASDDTRAGAAQARPWLELMRVVSEMTREPRPRHSTEDFDSAARTALRQQLGASMVLVVVGRGASIARGEKLTDAVLETVLGEGCNLGEEDCDQTSTDHEGIRADALLLDLETNRVSWTGRPANLIGPGFWGDHDPLHDATYAKADWLEKLFRGFPG